MKDVTQHLLVRRGEEKARRGQDWTFCCEVNGIGANVVFLKYLDYSSPASDGGYSVLGSPHEFLLFICVTSLLFEPRLYKKADLQGCICLLSQLNILSGSLYVYNISYQMLCPVLVSPLLIYFELKHHNCKSFKLTDTQATGERAEKSEMQQPLLSNFIILMPWKNKTKMYWI